jgi:hypothetical protein
MQLRERKEFCANCPKEGELARLATRLESQERRAEDIYECQLRIVDRLDRLIPAVARLEVKAGVWGGIGGLVAALVMAATAVALKM